MSHRLIGLNLHSTLLYLIFVIALLSAIVISNAQAMYINVFCFVVIALLGLPHGVIDPWLYDKTMMRKPKTLVFFCCLYLLVAFLMLMLWYWLAWLALLVFFAISALHFGQDWSVDKSVDESVDKLDKGLIVCLSAGTMVILWPFVTRTEESLVIIQYLGVNAGHFSFELALFLTCIAAMLLIASKQLLILGQLILLGIMSWLVDPFIYFSLYFCLFHSVLHYRSHLNEIVLAFRTDRLVFLLLLIATYLLIVLLLLYTSRYGNLEGAFYQTIFWILSALTVPHMLVVDGRLRRQKSISH